MNLKTIIAICFLIPSVANALVVDSTTRYNSTVPPASNPWFYNIGLTTGGASCIYLGNGWLITARHVGPSNVTFFNDSAATVHHYVSGSVRLFDDLDLIMFRVTPVPMLPDMVLNTTTPAVNDEVMMMGRGMTIGTPIVNLEVPLTASWRNVIGYHWRPTFYNSWGVNNLEFSSNFLTTEFNKITRSNEATAAPGDSGGAMFLKQDRGVNAHWALAGVIVTISTNILQEPDTSFYGNLTSAVNLLPHIEKIKGILNE